MPRWPVFTAAFALALGCAPYVTPAASEPFLATPFATIVAEVAPPAPPVRRRSLASARFELPTDKLVTAKLAAEKPPAEGLAPAALVEGALRGRGARFGTDGHVPSLYAYMRTSAVLVPARSARPGDVVFFQVDAPSCGDHAGVVETVDSGRITFREVRGGSVRRSYVSPGEPSLRRAPDGRILNSYLRPRLREDPPTARYFAGEMLCAVGRVRR